MFKMDFSFSFPFPCILLILSIIDGRTCTGVIQFSGNIGGNISVPLEIQNLTNLFLMKELNCSHLENQTVDCCNDCGKRMCLRNGFLMLRNLTEKDEARYTYVHENISKSFSLRMCDLPPAIHINCLPDGRVNLSCEVRDQSNDSVYWTLNGRSMDDVDACERDGGRRIILEKGARGKLVCHRRNTCSSSSIELSCNDIKDGDLLHHPLFLYILVACGGGAVLLAILASLITCCCMKSKHNFIQVPVEDEKDEGITLSAISSEGPKSPPNGDHHEATAVAGGTSKQDPESCESIKPVTKMDLNLKMTLEGEPALKTEEEDGTEEASQEAMIDKTVLEAVEDCFPDPIDG